MKKFAVYLGFFLVLVACSDQTTTANRSFQLVVESPFETNASTGVQPRALDLESLILTVRLNGIEAQTQRLDSTTFEVSGEFTGNTLEIDVSWSEIFEQIRLQLATYTNTIQLSDQTQMTISESDYLNGVFDNDRDGDSNLQERRDGTNPLNNNQCSQCRTDVDSHIRRISSSDAPMIDGSYDAIWDSAQFKDLDDDLFIRELVATGGSQLDAASVYDGEPLYRWITMHDGEFLYVFVLGESVDAGGQTPFRDSSLIIDDDSVTIEIETPAGSRAYEVPLLDTNNAPNQTEVILYSDGEVVNTADPTVSVGSCMCSGAQSTWEIRIPLDNGGDSLTAGSPFSLSVQVVDDVDGGGADFFWGWPRSANQFDGTVVLR
ncbi:MAG: hypothetical protein AB8B79_14790 [Granulosicoccus sp.]